MATYKSLNEKEARAKRIANGELSAIKELGKRYNIYYHNSLCAAIEKGNWRVLLEISSMLGLPENLAARVKAMQQKAMGGRASGFYWNKMD